MAKNIIEKAPFVFDVSQIKEMFDVKYSERYREVDKKGRYLYWDKFRYRVDEDDDPQKAWWAVKFARNNIRKPIMLFDKNNEPFYYCLPDSLEAKLYTISERSRRGITPIDAIKRDFLISSLIAEEAISSSQLEGASTTRKVAKEMLAHRRKPQNKDEEMILNNYLLMQEIKRIKDEELSVDMILDLHAIATRGNHTNGNIPGRLRTSDEIVIMDREDNILHKPPEYGTLISRLQRLCNFANERHLGEENREFINPIVKAMILHFMIGYEHPFADGNGRTARALFYWYMLKSGFDFFEYISISSLLKEAPKQYTLAYLYSEMDDNDLTYFLYYQADIILRAIDALFGYLEKKSEEFEEMTEILRGTSLAEALNFVQKDIIKKAIKHPGRVFNALEISADYDISPNTARKYLNELEEYKLLVRVKQGKLMTYIAPANLQALLKSYS